MKGGQNLRDLQAKKEEAEATEARHKEEIEELTNN